MFADAFDDADFVGRALVIVLREITWLADAERVVVARDVVARCLATACAATCEAFPLRVDAHERVALVRADLLTVFLARFTRNGFAATPKDEGDENDHPEPTQTQTHRPRRIVARD
jgi:hypothetical protein